MGGAERLVAIHDAIKLLNDYDSLELHKDFLPSPSLMQLQSDKRGVARRARAVVRNSSSSPGVNLISIALGNKNVDFEKVIPMIEKRVSLFQQELTDDDDKKTYCLIGIGKAEDGYTSLTIDIKSHESAIADPTEQLTATEERLTAVANMHVGKHDVDDDVGHPLSANTEVMNGDITQQEPKQQQHKHDNCHRKQGPQAGQEEEEGEEKEGKERDEKGREEKGREEREKGRKGERDKKGKGREA